MTSANSMHEAWYSKPVLWDNPEGQGREGRWRGVQNGEIHVHLWLNHAKNVWQKSPPFCKLNKLIKINILFILNKYLNKYLKLLKLN